MSSGVRWLGMTYVAGWLSVLKLSTRKVIRSDLCPHTSRPGLTRLAGGKSPGPAGFSCRRGSTERRDSPPDPTWVGADFDVSIS